MTTGMSPQRATLLAAIRKAMANGLSQQYFEDFVYEECMHSRPMALRGLLFGREFVQALFGIELMEWKVGGYRMLDTDGRPVRVPACDFHLRQLALSPDPLAYGKAARAAVSLPQFSPPTGMDVRERGRTVTDTDSRYSRR